MRICIPIVLLMPLFVTGCHHSEQVSPRSATIDFANDGTTSQVRTILAEQMGVKLEAVSSSTSLGDVGADELDFVELVMELEEKFNVSIPDDRAEQLAGGDLQKGLKNVTVGKLVKLGDELVAKKHRQP
jgi:acyl carrier protein